MPDDRSNQTDYLYRLGGVCLTTDRLATERTTGPESWCPGPRTTCSAWTGLEASTTRCRTPWTKHSPSCSAPSGMKPGRSAWVARCDLSRPRRGDPAVSARVQASGSWPRLPGADLGRPAGMSEPVCDVPADSDAVPVAVANARRGVITHLTIAGERVAAIVPESVIEARGRHALKGVTSPTCGSGSVVTG